MGQKLQHLVCVLTLAIGFPAGLLARSGHAGRKAQALVFVEVKLDSAAAFSHLKKGDELRGEAVRNVFSGYRLMVPAGSRLRLRVSGMERRRKISRGLWPWPVTYFRSKHEKFPTIDRLTVSVPGGAKATFPVSLVTNYDEVHVAAQASNAGKSRDNSQPVLSGKQLHKGSKQPAGSRLALVIEDTSGIDVTSPEAAPSSPSGNRPPVAIKTLAAGTETRLVLLDKLSASKNRPGDPFKAILTEPLRLDSGKILPEGSLFEGQVRKTITPRWLSRPGSLYLAFDRLVLPAGASVPIAASVVGIETNRRSPLKVGSEGGLSGGNPGRKQLLVDLGVGFGISKVADDSFQLIAEALISTATDASTAGTARLIGMGLGGLFFIKRHGRNVVLPPYTMITVRFDRSPSLLVPTAKQQGLQ